MSAQRSPGVVLVLAVCTTVEPIPPTPAPADETGANRCQEIFPLGRGGRWSYEGVVRSAPDGVPRERSITWEMEVIDVVDDEGGTAARLRGHPNDLPFTDGTAPRGDWLVLRTPGCRFFLSRLDERRWTEILRGGSGQGVDGEDGLFLRPSLVIGENLGGAAPPGWTVEETGVRPDRRRWYRLGSRELADHTIVTFVEGVGLTDYTYSHHGTLSDVELTLVAYQAAP